MPRGRAPGYDTQREQILARAAELFAKQGYTATSMNQVAEACGVSKPSLYHYVRDKYQLLFEIADDHISRLKTLVAEEPPAVLSPEARVRRLIERFPAIEGPPKDDICYATQNRQEAVRTLATGADVVLKHSLVDQRGDRGAVGLDRAVARRVAPERSGNPDLDHDVRSFLSGQAVVA